MPQIKTMYKILVTLSILHATSAKHTDALLGSHQSEFPKAHLKFMNNLVTRKECKNQGKSSQEKNNRDKTVCEKNFKRCWGYEKNCKREYAFQYPICEKRNDRSIKHEDVIEKYWKQGGFGYVKKKIDTIKYLCHKKKVGSSLRCSEKWEYCDGSNIFMDFRSTNFLAKVERFNENFFGENGEIGGFCHKNKKLFNEPVKHNSDLRSWNAELKHFSSLDFNPLKSSVCDETIERPVIFMKLDSGINMYHHFCDFLNLYISQHIYGSFSTDIQIVMWDTSTAPYVDLFDETWKAFSRYPVKRLKDFAGKKVCFRTAVFTMPPRTLFGLYYNTPLVPNCSGGGIVKAFAEHVLHRLGVSQENYKNGPVRVTLLRRGAAYRNIVNEDELVKAMQSIDGLNVSVVTYKYREIPFVDQVKISHNSDIFIGMHGAGLTHMIFQPDWAAVFELYNTEDENCYRNLASLRGLYYLTWEEKDAVYVKNAEKPSILYPNHPKFKDYAFNIKEFIRLLKKAVKIVKLKRVRK